MAAVKGKHSKNTLYEATQKYEKRVRFTKDERKIIPFAYHECIKLSKNSKKSMDMILCKAKRLY